MTSQKKPLFHSYFVQNKRVAKSFFKWKTVDCMIQGVDRKIYFEKKKIKAPEQWSQNAIDIAASKYLRRSVAQENSIEALVERIGKGFKSAIHLSQLLKNNVEENSFCEELKYLMYSQKAAFNSPVWFNLGLKEAYSLSSKSDHFAWNFKKNKIESYHDAYLRPQCSACFIQSIDDSLESIFDLVKTEAKLFKYGSGSGTNFSTLRSKYESLSTGGTSSGLISFLEVLDRAAGAIKSGGTTRRAAKMVCLDLDHPEIEDFIHWKQKEEKKAFALIHSGYSADLEGEAYKTISGQNANNSVRVPDRFMKLLGKNKKWSLKNRNGKKIKEISADDLWNQICEAAWDCADPGLQFNDTINRWHTCRDTTEIRASNPCSEYMFIDNSACNLASLNLVQFLDQNQNLKLNELMSAARTLFIAQESLVDFASYPTEKIAQNSHDYRPLGLGFANLGSLIMQKGFSYDSDEGRAWAGFLTALITGVAYLTSAEMAQIKGPFKEYSKNKKSMLGVLKKHQAALKKIDWSKLSPDYLALTTQLWDELLEKGKRYGFRNAQATVIAPTGTIGLIMDCDTTGIEPEFSLVKTKKLSGGGQLQIVNQSVVVALQKLNYSSADIESIQTELLKTNSVLKTKIKPEHAKIFSSATGDLCLSPEAHLKMLAAVQPFVSGAISKTVNMPNSVTIKEVSEIYLQAWKQGLKSVAIYRDGSKMVQPLSGQKSVEPNQYPKCSECGCMTTLESGCYRCTNCGTTTACAS